jgi:glutaredoxin
MRIIEIMKQRILIGVALIMFLGLYACDRSSGKKQNTEQKSVIIVYGSEHCNHCHDFREWLKDNDLKYTFHDVTADMAAKKEMMKKVKNAKIGKRVLYPVVDIDGRILSRPAHKTVQALLKK